MKKRLALCIVLIAAIAASAKAEDPVYFADPNLKTAIEAELAITDPTPTDMLSLTSLYANGQGITDLTGLEYATNLTFLELSNNQISDISALSGLAHLIFLNLPNNQISDISALSGLTNLYVVSLEDNPLDTAAYCIYIPMIQFVNPFPMYLFYDDNTNPLTLDCNCNGVDLAPFVDEWLADDCNQANDWCNGADMDHLGQVNGFDFAELARLWLGSALVYFADPGLKAAVEAELGITDPNPTDMLSLTNLYATSRGITDLTGLEYALGLSVLRLEFNQISDISPLSGLTNLTELNLRNNQISDISVISGLTNLTKLTLWNNQISDISAVSGLVNLTYLDLENNQISDISAISELTNLTTLWLGYNQISDISVLSGLTNLITLDMNYNPISDISAISGLTNLILLGIRCNLLNTAAHCIYIPMIEANNPGISFALGRCHFFTNLVTDNCSSDWFDLEAFVDQWLADNCDRANSWCSRADLDYTGQVDAADFAELANYWLAEP